MFYTINKTIIVLFWIISFLTAFFDIDGALGWFPITALFIGAVHFLEIVLFLSLYKKFSQAPEKDAVFILIFGIFHFYPLVSQKNIKI